jgi:hypothetical protein
MIELTGYPRIIIAKPSTAGAGWPEMCPEDFFASLDNSNLTRKYIGRAGDSPMLDDDYRYPYLVELSVITGLSESLATNSAIARERLALQGASEISGPTLATGFGGTDDGDGSIFGVALKTIVDYTSTMTLQINVANTDCSQVEFGNVGNFGWGESLRASSDMGPYPGCPGCILGEPGWKLNSERIDGFRHLAVSLNSTIDNALRQLAVESPLATVIERLLSSDGSLTFYSQLIYRYMPRLQSAFYFESASSLAKLNTMLNSDDMGWAGDIYDYNPDYDDCD